MSGAIWDALETKLCLLLSFQKDMGLQQVLCNKFHPWGDFLCTPGPLTSLDISVWASKLHLTPYRHPTPGYWELHQSSLEVSSCVSFTSSELQGPVRMQYTAAASSSATRYLLPCRLWVLQEKTVAKSPAVSSSRASHGLLQPHTSIHRAWTDAGAFSTAHCPSAQRHPCPGQARFEQGLNKLPSYLQVCSHGMMQCQMDVHISCRQKEACRYPISWADIQSSGTLHTFCSASCCCD